MAFIGGAGALVLETQSNSGTWFNGFQSTSDPVLGTVIGLSDDLVPSLDNTFDIGTNLNRLRTLHVAKINDNSAGETLEIGNYTSDTGVTGVYGQLQGKSGVWKLYGSGTTGILTSATGALQLSAAVGSPINLMNRPIVTGDFSLLLNNNGASQFLALAPSISSANGYISSSNGLTILTGTANLYTTGNGISLNSSSGASMTASTAITITAQSTELALVGNRDINMTATTRDVNATAARYVNITAAAANTINLTTDSGVVIRDTATTHALTIIPSSTGTSITTSGTGNTTVSLAAATVTLANQTTATTNISAGSASASTTTTNIGCSVAASTNTINIGRIAANDITTFLGTAVRTGDIVTAYLTSNYTYTSAASGQALPSLTYSNTGSRYLAWDNTNHRFVNNHGSLTLTVLITLSCSWASSTGARTIEFDASGSTSLVSIVGWAAGNADSRCMTCVVSMAPAATVTPTVATASVNEILFGSSGAYSARLNMQATVI